MLKIRPHLPFVVVLIIAVSLRLWYFQLPLVVLNEGDPNSRVQQTRDWVETPDTSLGLVWPPMHFIIMAIPTFLGFEVIWGCRAITFLLGVLSVPLLYFLVRKRFDEWTALISAFLLAINPFHIKHSVITMAEIPFFFTVLCSFWFTYRYIETFRKRDLLTASFFLICSSLIRYEGWQVAFYVTFFILYYQKNFTRFFLFGCVNALGIAWYIIVAYMSTNDPLYGLHVTSAELSASYAKVDNVKQHILAGFTYDKILPYFVFPVLCIGIWQALKKRRELPWLITALLMLALITYRVFTLANEPFWRYFSTGIFLLFPFLVIGLKGLTFDNKVLQLIFAVFLAGYTFQQTKDSYKQLYDNGKTPDGLVETASWFKNQHRQGEFYFFDSPGWHYTGFQLLAHLKYNDQCFARYPVNSFSDDKLLLLDSLFIQTVNPHNVTYVIVEDGTITDSLVKRRVSNNRSRTGLGFNLAFKAGRFCSYKVSHYH